MKERLHLITDSGSTKTTWVLYVEDGEGKSTEAARCTTEGINPIHMDTDQIAAIVAKAVAQQPLMEDAVAVDFYGSGCTKEASPRVRDVLLQHFPQATDIVVDSDIIGAAIALCGSNEGIACILGTGANSCLWNGKDIVAQTPALGYILGDEGSGAVLGRTFVNALYKRQLPESLLKAFEERYQTNMSGVIERVYRQPLANRWLASLSPFIAENLHHEGVERLVTECFSDFIRKNVMPYGRPDLPVSFVGSIASVYSRQLCKALESHGMKCGKIMKEPLCP